MVGVVVMVVVVGGMLGVNMSDDCWMAIAGWRLLDDDDYDVKKENKNQITQ